MKKITEPAPALPTNQPPPTVTTLFRLPQVKEVTGLGTTSIWKLVKERDFPPPVHLTGRARAWRSDEIQAWIDSRPRSDRSLRVNPANLPPKPFPAWVYACKGRKTPLLSI
jgi:prophage regulatory protein